MEKPTFEDVSLSPATEADFDFIHDLKCEVNSIYWGGFAAKPDYENLKLHYARSAADSSKITLVIRWSERGVGIISFRIGHDLNCIDHSTNISQKFSGLGLGVLALRKNVEYLIERFPSCEKIMAWIREDNPRSHKMVRACGFVETDSCEERYLDSDRKPVLLRLWIRPLK